MPMPSPSARSVAAVTASAFVHGYHVAFFCGAVLFFGALLVAVLVVNAKKEDVPASPGMPAG